MNTILKFVTFLNSLEQNDRILFYLMLVALLVCLAWQAGKGVAFLKTKLTKNSSDSVTISSDGELQ